MARKKMWSPEEMGEDELTINPDGRGFVNVHGGNTRLSQYLPHLIPLQFTGFKDPDNVEIYGGDVLDGDYPDEVYFDDDRGQWMLRNSVGPDDTLWETMRDNNPKIIGNIHENPELMP